MRDTTQSLQVLNIVYSIMGIQVYAVEKGGNRAMPRKGFNDGNDYGVCIKDGLSLRHKFPNWI